MDRNDLIENAILKIRQLSDEKIREIDDFAEFLLMKTDDKILRQGIQELVSESNAFNYLNEEDLYSVNDLKERYK
jgi:dimeric dUTPase (all-alpha-NTP-PPase superfamily)